MSKIRTITELLQLDTFDERLAYLKLGGGVGRGTFEYDRHINQVFYRSREWRDLRAHIIVRDNGCDLGVEGYEVLMDMHIHHLNPMTVDDIVHHEDWILNPEYLITTTLRTHNAIHYGGESPYPRVVMERSPGDTKLW